MPTATVQQSSRSDQAAPTTFRVESRQLRVPAPPSPGSNAVTRPGGGETRRHRHESESQLRRLQQRRVPARASRPGGCESRQQRRVSVAASPGGPAVAPRPGGSSPGDGESREQPVPMAPRPGVAETARTDGHGPDTRSGIVQTLRCRIPAVERPGGSESRRRGVLVKTRQRVTAVPIPGGDESGRRRIPAVAAAPTSAALNSGGDAETRRQRVPAAVP